jgi:hypothetical protein
MDSIALIIAVATGVLIGSPLGYLTHTLISAHHHRRISHESWAAARRFYLNSKNL